MVTLLAPLSNFLNSRVAEHSSSVTETLRNHQNFVYPSLNNPLTSSAVEEQPPYFQSQPGSLLQLHFEPGRSSTTKPLSKSARRKRRLSIDTARCRGLSSFEGGNKGRRKRAKRAKRARVAIIASQPPRSFFHLHIRQRIRAYFLNS